MCKLQLPILNLPMKHFVFYFLLIVTFSPLFSQENNSEKEALQLKKIEEQKMIKKLLDSSNAFYDKGEYNKSFSLNIKILPIAFKTKNPYYIHQAYRYLAYDYLFLNDTILAMDSFKKSESYAKLSKNDTATAVTYMDLGNVFSTNQDYEKAYLYFNRSINLFEKIKDSIGLAKANYNMVLAAMGDKNYDKALSHILKAQQLNKNSEDSSFSVNLDNFLGECYTYQKKYKKADSIFLNVLRITKNSKYLNIELENTYYLYSESLFNQGKYKEAYKYFKLYDKYSDLNSNIFTSEERYSLSQKFQLDEYRKDIETAKINNQLQAEIVESKTIINIILIIVSAIFLVLLIALYTASIKRIKLVKELRIKNKEALKAKEESEKLAKAKVKFFSTVSHELRTPLYGVIGLSSVLLEDESLSKHKKDLKFLKFSADYLLALINDVLQINKIDSEKFEEENTSFNLKELIETITSSFEYMRIQNDNQLHINISEDIPQLIRGNSVQLSQILMNIIGNACKFTENGDVYINVKTVAINDSKASIKFTIKDTGIGIAKEKHESIFDEFTQVDSLNYSGNGSGLGLPIVKKLLALSNSEITLESDLGKGATFTFTLTFEVLEKAVKDNSLIKFDDSILNDKKILIVEDNRINQIVTQKILEQKGIICSIAENGNEAIEKIKQNNYDLILMDINMPIKNGIEASKEIRLFNKTIPIIALTAVEIEEMRNNIYMSGMNDIVVKPYDISKFIDAIIKNISMNMKVNT